MTRLLERYRELRELTGHDILASSPRLVSALRDEIRTNLAGGPHAWIKTRAPSMYRYGDVREQLEYGFNGNVANFATWVHQQRANRKVFGDFMGDAIRQGDSDRALALLNDNTNIRDGSRVDWADVLNDKFSDYFHSCEDCNTITHEDDGSTTNYDSWVCQDCLDNNYTWSDRADGYVTNDDYDEEEDEDEDNGVIGSYHHSKRHVCHIPSAYDHIDKPAVLLGLELEMECSDSYTRSDKAQELYDKIHRYDRINDRSYPYAFFEEDGSLNYGFEMVTSYTGLDVHAEQLLVFKNDPVRGLRSHDTSSCGLHVHVSRAGMTTFHACKLAFFVHDSGNQRLLRAVARRSNSRHAKMVNKKADSQWIKNAKVDGIQRLNDDRYEAVNFQNGNTVEFRLFKGTLRYESIMACLEFAYITWFFSRDMGVTELTEAKFLEYICQPSKLKHTKFLREYLRSKNFSLPIRDKQPKQDAVEV